MPRGRIPVEFDANQQLSGVGRQKRAERAIEANFGHQSSVEITKQFRPRNEPTDLTPMAQETEHRQLASPERISQTRLYPVPDSGAPSGLTPSHSSAPSPCRKRRAAPTEYRPSSSPVTSR